MLAPPSREQGVHLLLRYGVLTASGMAGGRAGLNVDSAATRAALSRNEEMIAIPEADLHKRITRTNVGNTEMLEGEYSQLLTQLLFLRKWSSGHQRSARLARSYRLHIECPYLLICMYRYCVGHMELLGSR